MQEYRPRPSARARELLEGLLVDYRLQPGDRLPSERSLSEVWGLSRTTLRSAVALMEEDGRLLSRPGSGTFVAPEKYTRNLQGLLSMSQAAAQQGREVSCGGRSATSTWPGGSTRYWATPSIRSCGCGRWTGNR